MSNPILVEVTRGTLVESRHAGAAVVVDAAGTVVRAWGDVARPIYPRSANKPLQAIALVETGAAAHWSADDSEVALACASHFGEPRHTQAVAGWLGRVGLSAQDLECGAHMPYDPKTAEAMLRAGQAPSALHKNCSGKHTGFLVTAAHCAEPTHGYVGHDHPVQRRVSATLAEMCGVALETLPWGVDGCGIPTLAMPLAALARGTAQLADPSRLAPARATAARRIAAAMAAHPLMIGGANSFASRVTAAMTGVVIAKSGAEGVYTAQLPRLGLGIALKIDDGAPRAAEAALVAVLARVGQLDDGEIAQLHTVLAPDLRNRAGTVVGIVRPGPAFTA
ncbi:MAG: asparaginase [Alphaproteobacteria bacterium]|nr:asparaginase [Alphaproteobacteria bacterium]